MSSAAMMRCEECVELITDYLDGALSPSDQVRFLDHLDRCDKCPRYLRQIERTIRLTGELREDGMPEPWRAELLEAFRSRSGRDTSEPP